MANIYRYPNANSSRVTRTNLTQKCGMCNSAPILQSTFFSAPAGTVQKTLTTIANVTQSISKSIGKVISKTVQNVNGMVKNTLKNVVKTINSSQIKQVSVSTTKSTVVSIFSTIQKIKQAIKSLATSILTSSLARKMTDKQVMKQVSIAVSLSRLLALYRTFSTAVLSNGVVQKAITKTMFAISFISNTIEKVTTIIPKIYYKTLSATINAGDYVISKAISSIKLAEVSTSNYIRRAILANKSTVVQATGTKKIVVSILKYATVNIYSVVQKQINKNITKLASIIGSVASAKSIDWILLTISASFRNIASYAKSKFTKKTITVVDTVVDPQYSQTTSYVKEKYTKTTIE